MNEETGVLRASLGYPFRGEAWRTRLLLGGALHLLAGVVFAAGIAAAVAVTGADLPAPLGLVAALAGLIAYVPLFGHVAATARALLDEEAEPPSFGALDELAADGLRIARVVLTYALPLVVLAGLVVVAAEGASEVAAGLLGVVALLYALAAAYVLPAAVVTVVNEGSPAAARDVDTLREAVLDRNYLGAWAVGASIWAVGLAAGAALAPFVVGFVVLFVAQLGAVYAATRGVAVALDLAVGEPPAPPASGFVPGWDDGPRRKELSSGHGGALLPDKHDDEGADLDSPGGPSPGGIAAASAGDAGTDLDTVSNDGSSVDSGQTADGPGTDIERPTDGTDEDDLDSYDG